MTLDERTGARLTRLHVIMQEHAQLSMCTTACRHLAPAHPPAMA